MLKQTIGSWGKLLDHETTIGHANKLCTHMKATIGHDTNSAHTWRQLLFMKQTIGSWSNYWSWKQTLHTHKGNYCIMKQLLVMKASIDHETYSAHTRMQLLIMKQTLHSHEATIGLRVLRMANRHLLTYILTCLFSLCTHTRERARRQHKRRRHKWDI